MDISSLAGKVVNKGWSALSNDLSTSFKSLSNTLTSVTANRSLSSLANLSDSTDPMQYNENYIVHLSQDQDVTSNLGSQRPLDVFGLINQEVNMNITNEWKAPFGAGFLGEGTVGDLASMFLGTRLLAQVMTFQVWQGSSGDLDMNITFDFQTWSDPVADVLNPVKKLLSMSLPGIDQNGFLQSPGPRLDPKALSSVMNSIGTAASSAANAFASKYSESAPTQTTTDGQSKLLSLGSGLGNQISRIGAGASAAASSIQNSGIGRKAILEQAVRNKISIKIGRWFEMKNIIVVAVQPQFKCDTPEFSTGSIQSAEVTMTFRPMFAVTVEDINQMLIAGQALTQGRTTRD